MPTNDFGGFLSWLQNLQAGASSQPDAGAASPTPTAQSPVAQSQQQNQLSQAMTAYQPGGANNPQNPQPGGIMAQLAALGQNQGSGVSAAGQKQQQQKQQGIIPGALYTIGSLASLFA